MKMASDEPLVVPVFTLVPCISIQAYLIDCVKVPTNTSISAFSTLRENAETHANYYVNLNADAPCKCITRGSSDAILFYFIADKSGR